MDVNKGGTAEQTLSVLHEMIGKDGGVFLSIIVLGLLSISSNLISCPEPLGNEKRF